MISGISIITPLFLTHSWILGSLWELWPSGAQGEVEVCIFQICRHCSAQDRLYVMITSNDKQCGYFVMRYIIHDTNLSFADKWARRANHVYCQVKIDEVRNELASYVVKNILKL
ncbi:uncharacterized protein LOC121053167 isoform X1 [Rosa chinensis]|uniref:uncharacterized protein LOC121053167 isoform X1 n=1 Tax=Rosa chinensis TaxID=74649 RepID=UPI001AD8A39F|nr:uncharacterized protein LOC121053167 isoform X1 [Rosa chinensis]